MGKKRKRPVRDAPLSPQKKPTAGGFTSSHAVLSLYYPRVVTLRQYLLHQLPVASKLRRRRIVSLGLSSSGTSSDDPHTHHLAQLLDTTVVGVLKESSPTVDQNRRTDWLAFTQSQSQPSSDSGPTCAQSEIVNFVILTLFNRHRFSSQKPQHLLANGYQRAANWEQGALAGSLPGIVCQHPNQNVQRLKQAPWVDVLGLLGSNGEEIMMKLLFDCGIFSSVEKSLQQISGIPLSSLEFLSQRNTSLPAAAAAVPNKACTDGHKPNSIVFVRRRMLYARPALNAKGNVRFGLRHIHVLNRYPSADSMHHTLHVMKYVFPRQFGLHNVFVSEVDSRETVQPFKDYVFRDEEINQHRSGNDKIPRRLRGEPVQLIQKLQARNQNCPYVILLNHYCPVNGCKVYVEEQTQGSYVSEPLVTQPCFEMSKPPRSEDTTDTTDATGATENALRSVKPPQSQGFDLTAYATPSANVSAFCRAVLRKLIPRGFYGVGQAGIDNQRAILSHVDGFVRMRRYESLSLHQVCQGIKVASIPWLAPPNAPIAAKLAQTDLRKRTELLHEWIYYIFDSLLVPLIRTNFYVTESQTHRNRLFYFRHDTWRQLTERPLAHLKSNAFEELPLDRARRVLARRPLGYSTLRLLPKPTGTRPIMNLRRRMLRRGISAGTTKTFLEPSINSVMTPIYSMLQHVRQRDPQSMGSAIQSVGEIHTRLKRFKETLLARLSSDTPLPPLYFAKVDIQACFDTIPQQKLIGLVERIVSKDESFLVTKHLEVRLTGASKFPQQQRKPQRRFVHHAAPPQQIADVAAATTATTTTLRPNTVYTETLMQKEYKTDYLLDLLEEHVRHNIVKIGKKYFRQRHGIPQGSVLSSLLCNLFYAELERDALGFLLQNPEQALLLRLVDDFLLVTPDVRLARRFLQVMVAGQPEYGASVNPAKSLVNFDATVEGISIPRLAGSSAARFPYCGCLIDTRSLEIHRDQERVLDGSSSSGSSRKGKKEKKNAVAVGRTVSDTLTVETTRLPGQTLHRKMLAFFQLQLHPMYLDGTYNSAPVVLANLYAAFVMTAIRLSRYLQALRKPSDAVIMETVHDLIRSARGKMKTATTTTTTPKTNTTNTSVQPHAVSYLAAAAFRFVLARKQTRYATVLRWLHTVGRAARPATDSEAVRLARVVQQGRATFAGWRF